MAQGFSGGATPILTGGVSTTGGSTSGGFGGFGSGDGFSSGTDMDMLMTLFGQNSSGGGGLTSLLGGGQQQQQQQGNTYNQMMPSPMLPQQMLPMIQNTFVPQTQMQNFQPYSLLNGNLS